VRVEPDNQPASYAPRARAVAPAPRPHLGDILAQAHGDDLMRRLRPGGAQRLSARDSHHDEICAVETGTR
jgi:pantoate kinase